MGLKPRNAASAGTLTGAEFIPIDTGADVAEYTTPNALKTFIGSGSGNVVGPASAIDSNFASFNTTTGKLIKDSGKKASDFADAIIAESIGAAGTIDADPTISAISGRDFTADACRVRLYDNATFTGLPKEYAVPAANFTATTNITNYLYVDYNAGTPIYKLTTNVALINESDTIPINTILASNSSLHLSGWDRLGDGLANKLHRRFVKTQRYAIESGLAMSTPAEYTADGKFTIFSGVVWRGARAFDLDDCYSDGTNNTAWFFYYQTAPNVWAHTIPAPVFNTTQYSLNGVLTPLQGTTPANGYYNINWVFRGVEDHNHIYYQVSDKQYKDLATAQAESTVPPIAPDIAAHAILVGRIICQKSNVSPAVTDNPKYVEGAFNSEFRGTVINDHNSLSGLQGGGPNDYVHLTTAEQLALDDPKVPTSHASTHIADTGSDPLHAFDVNAMSYHGWATRDMTVGATPVTYGPLPRELTSTTFTLYGTRSTCNYYYQATKVTVTTDKTCTLDDGAGGSTTGLYYVYFNGVTGNILATKNFPGVFFTSNVLIATVTWNGADYGWVNDERHGYQRNGIWHYNQHKYVGTLYDSGIDFTTANSGAGLTFATTSGAIADEDIAFTVNASSAFPTANTCKLIRQTGAATYTTEDTVSTKPFYWNGGTTRVQYINAAGPYALADVNSARYINVWVYATTDLNTPIVAIAETLPTATTGYTTIALARAVVPPNLSNLAISPEMKVLYRIIMTGAGTVSETTDYRRSSPLPGGGSASTSAAAVAYTPTAPESAVTVQGALDNRPNYNVLGALATGPLKVTTSTGALSVYTIGTAAGTLAAGDDARFGASVFKVALLPGSFSLNGTAAEPLLVAVAGTNSPYSELQFGDAGLDLVAYFEIPSKATANYANGTINVDIDFYYTETGTATFKFIFAIESLSNTGTRTGPDFVVDANVSTALTYIPTNATNGQMGLMTISIATPTLAAGQEWRGYIKRNCFSGTPDTSTGIAKVTGVTVYES